MTEPVPVESPAGRRRRWPIIVAVLVVAAAATVGTMWMTRDDAPRVAREGHLADSDPELHYLVRGAPSEWKAFGAADMVQGEFALAWMLDGNYQSTMYGTADDPSAPAIVLGVGAHLDQFLNSGMHDWTDVAHDGTTGTCSTSLIDIRVCILDVDGQNVQTHSTGLSVEQLDAALATMTIRDGVARLDLASLPAGMSELGSWRNAMPVPVGSMDDHTVIGSVQYRGPGGAMANLWVGHADEQDLAAAFDLGATQPLTVDGVTYFHGRSESGLIEFITWQRAGRAFFMYGTVIDGVGPLSLARTVTAATDDEWDAAVTAAVPEFPVEPTPSTAPEPVTPTLARQPASVTDVDVTVAVADRGDRGIEVSSSAPEGVPVSLLLTSQLLVVGVDDVSETFGFEGDLPSGLSTARGTTSWGAYVITADARATTLRVTRANGDRYVAQLVPYPGRDGVRVAAVTVPIDEFVGADLLDSFGARLDAIGLPAD